MVQQKQLLGSLYNSKIARLATVDSENNQPYVVPVVFAFNGNNIFIPIDDKPKKTRNSNQLKRVKNIQKNPNISFLIDTYDDDWNNLSYLMIQGKARIVVNRLKDIDTIKTAHSLLSEKYFQYKKMIVGMGDSCIVIDIQKIISWKYSN